MDVAARLEAVEAENDMLRAKVDQLEELLGLHFPSPFSFTLTGQEMRVFGVLMKREVATKEMIMQGLYSHRPQDDEVEIRIVDVFICKIRKKLAPHGVAIETVWGHGYRLTQDTKAKVRGIMAQEGIAA